MSETNIPSGVKALLDEEAPLPTVVDQGPIYKIDPASKIAISKNYGKLWKSRLDAATTARKLHVDGWNEAIRYYNHDQLSHRTNTRDGQSGNRYFSARRNTQWSETENLVYANVRAIMPALYAKNPQAEFTVVDENRKDFVSQIEDLVNALASRKDAPGLNLKIHAKQAVLSAELCNLGWFEFGYTERSQSLQGLQQQLLDAEQRLEKAKDTHEIRTIEGELMALDESFAFITAAGPFVKYRAPHSIVVDADATMPDFSDAKYIWIEDFYPTSYLNARYGSKDEDGIVKSLYEPTHVLLASDKTESNMENFKLFETDAEAHSYGYNDTAALQRAHRTKCWRIWDKITRRIYLYADNKWDWPIWVENDPYGLPNFYPLVPLFFNTTPIGAYARSPVTYYLDQQDAVNEIHDEFRRARQDIRENVLYDNKFNKETVELWLKGQSPSAHGVEVPDGRSLKDMILEKPNAMLKALQLFDPQRSLQAIDRVSGVSDVLRNAQFKTNTTNRAIENYNSSTAMRLDEKIDAIEDALGTVFYGIGFLCAQFMSQEEVASVLGEKRSKGWQTFDAETLRKMFGCQSVGGSAQKPTSAAKKQQAIEMGKLLSQMAQFAPSVVLETTLTMFEEAFDELELPDNWADRMKQEAQAALQKGRTDNAGRPGSGGGGAPALQELAAIIDSLPPQAKQALGTALARGVPVAEALPEVLRMVSNNNPAQQQRTMQ
jgi:hypothetical protein